MIVIDKDVPSYIYVHIFLRNFYLTLKNAIVPSKLCQLKTLCFDYASEVHLKTMMQRNKRAFVLKNKSVKLEINLLYTTHPAFPYLSQQYTPAEIK